MYHIFINSCLLLKRVLGVLSETRLVPNYVRGDVFLRLKVDYRYENPFDTDIHLHIEHKPDIKEEEERRQK